MYCSTCFEDLSDLNMIPRRTYTCPRCRVQTTRGRASEKPRGDCLTLYALVLQEGLIPLGVHYGKRLEDLSYNQLAGLHGGWNRYRNSHPFFSRIEEELNRRLGRTQEQAKEAHEELIERRSHWRPPQARKPKKKHKKKRSPSSV